MSVALMGHAARQHFIDQLAPQLPGVEVVLDRKGDRWETGRRSLLAFDPAADFHCVVQDDAVLCADFIAGAELAARAAGRRPVGLYVGKVRPHANTVTPAVRRALRGGHPWIHGFGPLWGVAIVLPTAHIAELVAWADERQHIANYDSRIGAWYREQGIDCWYTVPSLADHRPVAENPSLVAGRNGNRRAHVFLGDRSPLDIDWGRPPIPIHGLHAEAVHPDVHETRRQYMGLRRYELTHDDGSTMVKLIDESQVRIFQKAAGVVSVEPVDDETFDAKPVEFDGDDGDEPENVADEDESDDDDESEEDEDSVERDDDGEEIS